MRQLVHRVLTHRGFSVEAVSNGEELSGVLSRARRRSRMPAAVVSDVRMPGANVMGIVGQLRGWGWSGPVLLVTAFADERVLAEAGEVDATAVLSKPFDLDDLLLILDAVIERSTRRSLPTTASADDVGTLIWSGSHQPWEAPSD